ncbi:DUF2778 domain-containing protein [Simiduia sp. 21SJ11W-1]|uniref:tlde1 domain-containing protein n=1 Tax=Simiduia sp. 21SJ11W-1 TaxID=2909669 RepID=UPI00209DCED0|nr:tlde1 domain-containing protein [Simiduia sp. 21SJ11W-1]UTA47078.1 DUF2778 domain-containing protein [Simiduia sp. 21SJ11W-1]
MIKDMTFNGRQLIWPGKGTFKATSGLPEHQMPKHQCVKDFGPIPEGNYKVFIADQGTAKDDGTGRCAISPAWGIQTIPRGEAAKYCEPYWANWGFNRARMEPADNATKNRCAPIFRNGFYLHDSTKGYSHGCIEVEGRIFRMLREYNRTSNKSTLLINVTYTPGVSTNGGTKR